MKKEILGFISVIVLFSSLLFALTGCGDKQELQTKHEVAKNANEQNSQQEENENQIQTNSGIKVGNYTIALGTYVEVQLQEGKDELILNANGTCEHITDLSQSTGTYKVEDNVQIMPDVYVTALVITFSDGRGLALEATGNNILCGQYVVYEYKGN